MPLSRDDHDRLEKLITKMVDPKTNAEVGERAVVGAISHLIVLAAAGRRSELRQWLYDSNTFTTWLSTVSSNHTR
jgi:hypothetical protein